MWNKNLLVDTDAKLQRIRSDLQLRVLVSIRARIDLQSLQQDHRVLDLEARYVSTTNPVNNNLSDLQSQLAALMQQGSESEQWAGYRHEEIIVRLKEISSSGVAGSESRDPQAEDIVGAEREEKVQNAILSSLWFPTMQDREDSIAVANTETLRWIYYDTIEYQKPWSDLKTFLEGNCNLYWITGKAGSGKSTLMKYINTEPQTSKHLAAWKGDRHLLLASFYFYYNGLSIQKSQIGVIQSLLYNILDQERSLIPVALPKRYQAMCSAARDPIPFDPTYEELTRALSCAIQTTQTHCFFFSIDGLDEYERENGMADFAVELKKLSLYSHVKVLLSSRPLQVFEEAFASCARLRLHEFTRSDITLYTENKLRSHKRAPTFSAETINSLVGKIVDSSAGVFLWVRLVVNSLLEGFGNGDSIEELEQRLHELPTDLEELYRHIFNKISPRYRGDASRLLQLVQAGTADGVELNVLELSFADSREPDLVFNTKIEPMSVSEVQSRSQILEARLKSRCLGLLEIVKSSHSPPPTDWAKTHMASSVKFLHRSILEFITREDIRRELLRSEDDDFDANICLVKSAVHMIKAYNINDPTAGDWENERGRGGVAEGGLPELVFRAGFRCRQAELSSRRSQSRLVDELDIVMKIHFKALGNRLKKPRGGFQSHWFASLVDTVHFGSHASIISFAARCGMPLYISEQIHKFGSGILTDGIWLLYYAVKADRYNWGYRLGSSSEVVRILLEHQRDPMPDGEFYSGWCAILTQACAYVDDKEAVPLYMLEMIREFVLHGANPNEVTILGQSDDDYISTALRVTERIKDQLKIRKIWMTYANMSSRAQSLIDEIVAELRKRGAISSEHYSWGQPSKHFP